MLKTIFSFEFSQWFNKPLFYVYCLAMAGFGAFMMAAQAGIFEGSTSTVSGLLLVNSPLQLTFFVGSFTAIAFFLLPSIVGATVQKDFKSNMFHLLYSFPFNKRDYIFGKFLTGFLISFFLLLLLGFGIHVGTTLPGVDQNLIAPFNPKAYLLIYLVFVLPNLFLFSAIVFSVTIYTRSIIAGFIAVAALFFGQGMADAFLANLEYDKLGAYLDPFGVNAVNYYAKYWTITEQNELLPPINGIVLHNRIIWALVGIVIFGLTYWKFRFDYEPSSLNFWKKRAEPIVSDKKLGLIEKIELPNLNYNFNWTQKLRAAWALSKIDLNYILKGGPFIVVSIIGILFIIILVAFSAQIFQTDTLPVTRQLLTIPGFTFSMFITLLTFIYTGLLIHRPETVRIFQLEDSTATSNFSFLLSKFISVVIMQAVLLSIIMLTGIALQIYNGYYKFEIDLYLFDLYGVRLINYVVWTFLAFFVYVLFSNFYLGLFVLLTLSIGSGFVDRIGIEQDLFIYNEGPNGLYSDMSGYGFTLPKYYLYKFYWTCLGIFLVTIALLKWRRGMRRSVLPSFIQIRDRFTRHYAIAMLIPFIAFGSIGGWIYKKTNIDDEFITSKEEEKRAADYEKNYKAFQFVAQPRIVDVFIEVNLFTEERDISGKGKYQIVNKSDVPIDTIMVDHNRMTSDISLSVPAEFVWDSVYNIKLFQLQSSLPPGDTMTLEFKIENPPNNIVKNYSPVRRNGTFFNSSVFPTIGYDEFGELTDDKTRRRYGLEPKERLASPDDSVARMNTYISSDADWIDFEAIISTASDQIAMTPGKLQREWMEDGRRYFHYKMQSKMLDFYNVISARYEVYSDQWRGLPIEIYYHKGHNYNLERMMRGAKAALSYCNDNFSPYQHDQMRILEFPVTQGGFAQSFANTVPFSEGVGFIADVDDEGDGVDYPFAITAHEIAHQWWAHQVIGAKVQGATVMSESLSEYVSLKVLERENGKDQMRTFLKDALDRYLLGRTIERKKEQPLAFVENQQHIHYNKGSLVFYALSDYISEDSLNLALKRYVQQVAFQDPPYTTCLELLEFLREVTPDSLQYFLDDSFLHITAYSNRITDNNFEKLENGNYKVTISAEVVKYRADERGRRIYKNELGDSLAVYSEGKSRPKQSFPLADYIDVGVFAINDDGEEEILYLEKHRISKIENEFIIEVSKEPSEVGIDPFNKLIDTNSEDNRRKAEEK